jgi:hypothetical protein
MKCIRVVFASVFFVMFSCSLASAAGFFLPDSVNEITLKFKTVKGLIVLPVTINDSINVNLILDTGCRNLILFGRKFKKLFTMTSDKQIRFSGLGSGRPVTGTLSIGNKVSISEVLGAQIPVVVVGSNNVFGNYHNVHGVIGYDIFLKFEIELDVNAKTIIFRHPLKSNPPPDFSSVPMRIVDSRPVMKSRVIMSGETSENFDVMIDTGSCLGLLLKTTDIAAFHHLKNEKVLGVGFNGPVSGYEMIARKLVLRGLELERVPTGIVSSPWHNNASIGMDILKDYVVILNYCKAYACFKRNV